MKKTISKIEKPLQDVCHFPFQELSQNFDFCACLSQNVVKCDASGKKGKPSCCKCIFDQIKANLANIQAEKHQNVPKTHFWQKALGVNGLNWSLVNWCCSVWQYSKVQVFSLLTTLVWCILDCLYLALYDLQICSWGYSGELVICSLPNDSVNWQNSQQLCCGPLFIMSLEGIRCLSSMLFIWFIMTMELVPVSFLMIGNLL